MPLADKSHSRVGDLAGGNWGARDVHGSWQARAMIGLFVDMSTKRPIIILSSFEWEKQCFSGASCQTVGTLGV
jgi:hypothetical protein